MLANPNSQGGSSSQAEAGPRKISHAQYLEEAKQRLEGVPKPRGLHVAGVCPACGTVQSIADFLALGIVKSFDEAQEYAHFSCIGRWTNAGPSRSFGEKGKQIGCDWTLGGLLQIAQLFVITAEGKEVPRFELATAEETLAHARLTDVERVNLFRRRTPAMEGAR